MGSIREINKDLIYIPEYQEIFEREHHHNHPVVEVEGVMRWAKNPSVDQLLDNMSLNHILMLFEMLGYNKNSEIYRQLYRDMGYSLSGYYDVFYWKMNNDEADEYVPENINTVN